MKIAEAEEHIKKSREYINNKLQEMEFPEIHPFYIEKEEAQLVRTILEILNIIIDDKEVVDDLIKKCRGVECGKFDYERYNQGYSEIIILYYLYLRAIKSNKYKGIIYESKKIFDNDTKLEYSFGFQGKNGLDDLVNIEIKTMICDPFFKETCLKSTDGLTLMKVLFNDIDNLTTDLKTRYPDDYWLMKSNYYTPLKRNINKIILKYQGDLKEKCNPINIGIIVINRSTSIEEFYSYFYHKAKGIMNKLDNGNLDALILFSLDAKVTPTLDNLYDQGYIQTIVFSEEAIVREYLQLLQLDNYIQIGKSVREDIYEMGQKEYLRFKIMNREGFLNIIPAECTEEDIKEYLEFLKNGQPRGGSY